MKDIIETRHLSFEVRPDNTDQQVVNEVVTADVYRVLENIQKDDIVIDIGGHIGTFAVFAASRQAKVFSYEPLKDSFRLLEKNIEMNGFTVSAQNIAVTGKNETRILYLREENFAGSNLYDDESDPKLGQKVKCTSLDKIFHTNKLDHCDFLKLDCEGSEVEILQTTTKLPLVQRIVVETHRGDREQVIELLSSTHELVNDLGEKEHPILTFERKP